MKFYLGVHQASWLSEPMFKSVPLFLSHSRLKGRKTLTPAVTTWGLDSGGFSQLLHNVDGWPEGSEEPYVEAVHRYMTMGGLDWASPQDWMCEPWLIRDRSVLEHQERTTENYLRLVNMAPELPWAAVIQGWKMDDYHRHVDIYAAAGVDLTTHPRVGIGSVCRRQHTNEIVSIVQQVSARGISLHGFGVKTKGLEKMAGLLSSADSMSWSFGARRDKVLLAGHYHGEKTKNCANCPIFALKWRNKLVDQISERV